jgi:hypothetical protein
VSHEWDRESHVSYGSTNGDAEESAALQVNPKNR